MRREINNEEAGETVLQPAAKCPKNYQPWIWTLVAMAIVTIIWALYGAYQQDGYFAGSRRGNLGTREGIKNSALGVAGVAEPAQDLQNSYHRIIESVRPAVISIDAAVPDTTMAANQGNNTIEMVAGNQDITYNRIGSGVIIDPQGFVLSSYHVVAGAIALKATVHGAGGAIDYPLKLVKADPSTDLALLRIQGNGPFPYAIIGDSEAIRTGDVILSMGSPFGFDQTMTSGIISSRRRTIMIGGTVYDNLVQTDAPINKGSSGGPLVSTKGEVIGINTAIFAPTGVFNGIGFAIPINSAADLVGGVIDFKNLPAEVQAGQLVAWTKSGRQSGNTFRLPNGQILTPPHAYRGNCCVCHPQLQGQVAVAQNSTGVAGGLGNNLQNAAVAGPKVADIEPFLGLTLVDVDDVIARQFNRVHPEGVLVNSVMTGMPADTAGLKRGDILVRINGRKIQNLAGFKEFIGKQKVGDKVEIVYLRDGSRNTVKIKTGATPVVQPTLQARQGAEFEWIGADIVPLIPVLSPYEKTGVYVQNVEGVLAASGVKSGDIIKGINGTPVLDLDTFVVQAKKADVKRGFLLDVIRSGKPLYISVKG